MGKMEGCEMKKFSRWLIIILAGILASYISISLVGCGDNNGTKVTEIDQSVESGQTGDNTNPTSGMGSGPITEGPGVTIESPSNDTGNNFAYEGFESVVDKPGQKELQPALIATGYNWKYESLLNGSPVYVAVIDGRTIKIYVLDINENGDVKVCVISPNTNSSASGSLDKLSKWIQYVLDAEPNGK